MANRRKAPWSDTPRRSQRTISAMARIAAVLRSGAWQFATSQGLNPAQVDILELLLARQQGVRLSWIARQLGVSTASASDSISALEAKSLVEKGRSSEDGRALALNLTSTGKALARSISAAAEFAHRAVENLPEQTQENLFLGLLLLIRELQQSDRFPDLHACLTCRHFRPDAHPGADAPHHCDLVGVALPISLLRLDCPDHEPAGDQMIPHNWSCLRSS